MSLAQRSGSGGTGRTASIEMPTVILACCIYGGWLLLTLLHAHLPLWLLVPAGAWITAWHMSLQHEVLHGHPTPWQRVNDAIGFPPLSLWLPYRRYRALHLAHHAGDRLTDPVDDPESHYVLPDRFARATRGWRVLLVLRNTLAGRMLLGPILGAGGFLIGELRALRRDRGLRGVWMRHLAGAALVVAWLLACRMNLLTYLLAFVYPGYALALIRSFAEHRAAEDHAHRTAIVERAPVLGLLFLHNNLHVLHHLQPGLPWFRLPRAYRARRAELIARNGGLLYRGYLDVARRYLLTPHDRPDNVFTRATAMGRAADQAATATRSRPSRLAA